VVGVLARPDESEAIVAHFVTAGGRVESHDAPQEAITEAAKETVGATANP